MPMDRPDLLTLVARIVGDVDTRLPALFARIPQNPANVFCQAVGGLTHGAYGYVDNMVLQVLPTTATGRWLADWGKMLDVARRPATKAVVPLSIVVTVNPTTVVEGTIFRRTDGTLYETIEELTANANPFLFEVTALEEGEAGSVTAGTVLTMTGYVAGLGTTATATADGDGQDLETEEDWRARILYKMRNHLQGGADVDYIEWAKSVPGVGDAWVIASTPPFVDLRIISDDEDDLEADSDLIDAVTAYIEDGRRPLNAVLVVASATVVDQDFTFTTFEPNTPSTVAAVTDALSTLLKTIRKPAMTLRLNAVIAAIENTGVLTDYVMTVPAADVVFGSVNVPTMGDVTVPP